MAVVDLASKAVRRALFPISRAYARLVIKDRKADPVIRTMSSLAFWTVYGYWPNLRTPRRFAERLWTRMLDGRNPLLTLVSDKYRVRDFVTERAGPNVLVPLLWSGLQPEDIPYDRLPSRFVIKTNHGCGYNILVTDKAHVRPREVEAKLRVWLSVNYGLDTFLGIAWGYKNISPRILVEKFLGQENNPPIDYKFYCFAGRAELVTVHFDRYGDKKSIAFDPDFRRLLFKASFKQFDINHEKPHNYEAMRNLAERLAQGFNFIRVDLYSLEDCILFGELTPYPVGVSKFVTFDINELDEPLGKKWGTNPEWI